MGKFKISLLLIRKHGLIKILEWNSNNDWSVYDDFIFVSTGKAVRTGQQQQVVVCA